MANDIAHSIVIPAFNEASGLAMTLEHLHAAHKDQKWSEADALF